MGTEHVRYIVEITQVTRVTSTETKEFCTKQEPTEIMEDGYSGGRKQVTYKKDFEVREIPKVEIVERRVYRQELSDLQIWKVVEAVNMHSTPEGKK